VWDDGALSYADLDARACAVARALDARGVRSGDRVAITIPNRWQFIVAVLGGLKAGATVAPLDPLLKAEERAEILADLVPAVVLEDAPAESATWTARDPRGPARGVYNTR
jgi:long-chain acyl-CoA synthetase